MNRSEPAYIEIVERVSGAHTQAEAERRTAGYIRPNLVRVNGTPLACPAGEGIYVHAINVDDGDVLKVTLTLFARHVTIHAEPGAA
jgi:hypothetical protein